MKKFLIAVIILLISVSVLAVPQRMTYQGKLTNPAGIGINDTLPMVFRIFTSPTGGVPLWEETQDSVVVIRGLFNVELGSVNPLNLLFDTDYWLEIAVGADDLIPRMQLLSVPYTFRAGVADSAIISGDDGDWTRLDNIIFTANPSDSVGIGTTTPNAKLDVSGDVAIGGDLAVVGQIDPVAVVYQPQVTPPLPLDRGKLYYDDALDFLRVYNGSSWIPLGIGGTFQKLHVAGNPWLSDSAIFVAGSNVSLFQNADSIIITSTGGAADGDWNVDGDDMYAVPMGNVGIGTLSPGARFHIEESDSVDPLLVRVSGNPHFTVKNDGRVGINRSDPSAKLHISVDDTLDILSAGLSGDARFIVKNDGNVGIGSFYPTARLYVVDNDSTDLFRTVASGDTKFMVDNDGNVGIATATPGCKLHVNCGYGFIKADQSEGEILESHYEGGGVGQALKASLGASTYALLAYEDPVGSYSGQFQGTVYINGKLGIGTAEPQYGVHYVGNAALTTMLIAPDTTSNGDSKILLGEDPDFDRGMGIKYEGEGNYLFIYGKDMDSVFTNLLTVKRESGRIGIGTADPDAKLHIRGGDTYDPLIAKSNGQTRLIVKNNGWVGIGVDDPQARLDVFHKIQVSDSDGDAVVEIGEGLDYAEGFDVSENDNIESGMILVIDPDNPGMLVKSSRAYDIKVAGIVAGANELASGVRLGSKSDFDFDVALAGRVYCYVDATNEAISPGDLLTTSDVPGYAMKVTDHTRAQGAILGKAMEPMEKGRKGQILVLVTLQ